MTALEVLDKARALDLVELAAAAKALDVALGLACTQLEKLGELLGWGWLEKLGQRGEAFFADVPKIISGSRFTQYINRAASKIQAK